MATKPKTPGGAIDAYGRAWEKRLEAEKAIKKLKTEEREAQEHMLGILNKSRQSAGAGRDWKITTKVDNLPTAESWEQIDDFIMKTGDTSILQKRLHKGHCEELREDGQNVPGVKWETKIIVNRPTRVK